MGHIIITTRRHSLEEYATAGIIRLDKMDPDEAVNLLLRYAYAEQDDQRYQPQTRSIARSIAEKLGYLAIALHQAGATIRCKICTLEKYLSSYRGYRLLPPNVISSYKNDTITTWEVPFQRLENRVDMPYRDAVAIFHILAFMHHQPVHESIIQACWSKRADNINSVEGLPDILQCSALNMDQSQARLRVAFNILHEYSIIELDPNTRTCIIHPVIHEWARHRIKEQGTTFSWLRCTSFVLACAGSNSHCIPHEFASNLLVSHLDSFLGCVEYSEPSMLLTAEGTIQAEQLASIYERTGYWGKSLKILEAAIDYRTRVRGSRHEDTLRVKRQASLCHWNLFQIGHTLELQRQIWEAQWWSRKSIFEWTHPLRPQHVGYGIALSDLTQSLWLAGDLTRSKQAGERAMGILEQRLGDDDLRTVDAMFNLGRTCRHLGSHEQAYRLLIFVLRKRKLVLGLDHLDTLMARNELGMCLYSMNRHLALAERMVENVLKVRERVLGAEHAYTMWSVNDLSKVLCARGRFDQAIRILEDIIPAVIRTLGEQHVGMHMTKGNLARAYAYCRRWDQTERVLKEMLADDQLGQADRLPSQIGLIRIQIKSGKLAEAEMTSKTLLSELVPAKSRPGDDKAVTTVAGLLAETFRRHGDHEQLDRLQRTYPDLDKKALDQPFELT